MAQNLLYDDISRRIIVCNIRDFSKFALGLPRCGSVAQRNLSLRHAGNLLYF